MQARPFKNSEAAYGGPSKYWAQSLDEAAILGHLFQPESITPSQGEACRQLTPEQLLLDAIFKDALVCVRRAGYPYGVHAGRLRDEALVWFLSDAYRWGSFLYVADHLNLPAEAVQQWAQKKQQEVRLLPGPRVPPRRASRKSIYRGVYWHKQRQRWHVRIGEPVQHVGYFQDEEEAARAYDAACLKLRGKRAKLNFPETAARVSVPVDGRVQVAA